MRTLSLAVLGLGAVILSGCDEKAETRVPHRPESKAAHQVTVSRVRPDPATKEVTYVGSLTAHRKVEVASETSGTIERILFEKGDEVTAGQLLAEVSTSSIRLEVARAEAALQAAKSRLEKLEAGSRPEEIRIARATLKEAEANLFEAERNFNRIRNLHEIQAVSKSEFDTAKRRIDIATAKMDAAGEQLALARQGPRMEDKMVARAGVREAEAALSLARDRLRKSMLRSPCNGVMGSRSVEVGEVIVVPPTKVIGQVVDLSRMRVRLFVSEKDLHVLDQNQELKFTVDAIPGKTYNCRLFFRSPTADPATRTFPVELEVTDPDPRMADGMTARVSLPLAGKETIVAVPTSWLSEQNGRVGLYVAADDEAQFREVVLGNYYDQRVEIRSGVQEGDLVITTPAGLKAGDPVTY